MGYFDVWVEDGFIVYCYVIVLLGGEIVLFVQVFVMFVVVCEVGECFYLVFYFLVWGGKSVQEVVVVVMFEIVGEV